MAVLKFLKDYWFLVPVIAGFLAFIIAMIDAVKCSLRNDILTIYDSCKKEKKISKFQMEAIEHSAEVYFKLGGNSFVKQLMAIVSTFELID